MGYMISGIQQVGIGVCDAEEAFRWYQVAFGMDICVFKDEAQAVLMTRYTGQEVHSRYAILAMNMEGGGGFEIWQYTSRKGQPLSSPISFDQLGILVVKLKTRNIETSHLRIREMPPARITEIMTNPVGRKHFYVLDPFGNWFEVIEADHFFLTTNGATGGVCGCVFGVSQMENSIRYFRSFGFDTVDSDTIQRLCGEGVLPESTHGFRRVFLSQSQPMKGPFGQLLGPVTLELLEIQGEKGAHVYHNRQWGDPGFIHLCFDVREMNTLGLHLAQTSRPFTVDSSTSFDMGKAAGHFCYHEDPDGTLIELVETHKLPLLPKLGWHLRLKNQRKPLPKWLLGMMRFSRIQPTTLQ
jgi:catechol 2,3-dioxygenase-like lactoylglutathione lyase family enzyme